MKTPITYHGGKQSMLKHILPIIPYHEVFTESFCGGAAVLFAKRPSPVEVINDINRGLINFYKVLKTDYPKLKKEIDLTLHSRDQHKHARYICEKPDFFDPVKWAWAVWYLSAISFASKINGSFGFDYKGDFVTKFNNKKESFIKSLSDRLTRITIENDNALNIIKRYDCPGAFHFIDPPYLGTDCAHYSGCFNEKDLEILLDTLEVIKGRFMLTMFPEDNLSGCIETNNWHKISLTHFISASAKKGLKREEWIITNYDPATVRNPALF